MKNTYQRTNWVDNETPVNAENLNKIEEAIDELYSGSVGISQLKKGKGVDIKLTDFREVELGINPFEMNEMVEHNKYVEGNGIVMKDTTPPLPPIIPTPDTTIDEWVEDEDKELINKPPFPPLHPPTEISIDEDYVNDIVKHNKYIGSEGVIVEKKPTTEGEEKEELVKDQYSVKADIEYIDENITHPNYVGIRGIKIRKPVLDQIFPELEIDERTKVAYLDEDYLNDFAIDVKKLAERLNIAPIVEYVAGNGLEIVDNINGEPGNEIHEPGNEPTQEEGEETPTNPDSETAVTEIVPGEDQTMQEAVMEDIVNEEIGEPESTVPEKIYKTIRLDEEWLDERLENHDPEFVSDLNTGLSITKAEVDNEAEEGEETAEAAEAAETTYVVEVDKSKLQEYLEVKDTPNIQGEENSGITVSHTQPETSDPYTPTIDTFTIGVNPEELRMTLNVKENPVLTTENGITLTITETPSQDHQESVENWKIGLDTDYVNSIVKHKYYTFRSPFFTYKNIDEDHGEISFNEEYFTTRVTEIVNQILRSKGL